MEELTATCRLSYEEREAFYFIVKLLGKGERINSSTYQYVLKISSFCEIYMWKDDYSRTDIRLPFYKILINVNGKFENVHDNAGPWYSYIRIRMSELQLVAENQREKQEKAKIEKQGEEEYKERLRIEELNNLFLEKVRTQNDPRPNPARKSSKRKS